MLLPSDKCQIVINDIFFNVICDFMLCHSYKIGQLYLVLTLSSGRVGARRVGDVEGVRQSTGNWQRDPNMKWNRRIIIRQQQHSNIKQNLYTRRILGEHELEVYDEESRKKPEPVKSPVQQQHEAERKTRKKQKKQTHSYSTRSVRDEFEVSL